MNRPLRAMGAILLIAALLGLSGTALSQEGVSGWTLSLTPFLNVPLQSSVDYYRFVGGGKFGADFRMPFFPLLYLGGGLGYTFYSIRDAASAEQSLSLFSGSGGLGLHVDLGPVLGVKAFFRGGYEYGFSNDPARPLKGGGAFIEPGAELSLTIQDTFDIALGATYRNDIGLFNGLGLYLGTGFRLIPAGSNASPLARPSKVEARDLLIPDIFPVFHKFYDDHPVGSATLFNGEKSKITGVKVFLEIKPYMTAPKECPVQSELTPGESANVDLYGLFSEDRILGVTEGTKASAELSWEYAVNGQARTGRRTETVRILNRNAMTWEDDRRAAAFVTALDPAVLTFSKNISGMVKSPTASAIDPKILSAIAIYEGLCQYGLSYAIDPKSSYADFSQQRDEVDFLQFPQQTLEYKAGDCDDLSILFCALFESIGVDTAFITVPGHIYMAFALAMKADEARSFFQREEDLIFEGERVWFPLEVTALDGRFLEAWQYGAKEWRDAQGQASIYPLSEAWRTYEPVGMVSQNFKVSLPSSAAVQAAYQREAQRFAEHEIAPQISMLLAEIKKNQESPALINKLGILYAKNGLVAQAEEQFKKITAKQEYLPALINLGNLAFLRKDMESAAAYFERAHKRAPGDAKAIANLARAYYELEKYAQVKELYERLLSVDPALAKQVAYLDMGGGTATRAADLNGTRGAILWGEE